MKIWVAIGLFSSVTLSVGCSASPIPKQSSGAGQSSSAGPDSPAASAAGTIPVGGQCINTDATGASIEGGNNGCIPGASCWGANCQGSLCYGFCTKGCGGGVGYGNAPDDSVCSGPDPGSA
ncbi:MAG: hypothetical protein ACREJ3_10335, partial [Polyangiaceae bacterium]